MLQKVAFADLTFHGTVAENTQFCIAKLRVFGNRQQATKRPVAQI